MAVALQTNTDLQGAIERAWDERDKINPGTTGAVRNAVETALDALDAGKLRVADKKDGAWRVHEWLKKAVLLSFRLNDSAMVRGPVDSVHGPHWWFDKVPLKFTGWDEKRF